MKAISRRSYRPSRADISDNSKFLDIDEQTVRTSNPALEDELFGIQPAERKALIKNESLGTESLHLERMDANVLLKGAP